MWTVSFNGTPQARYVLSFGKTRFAVAPALGGRIIEFSLNGDNVLCEPKDLGDWTNGGSTFWTSPQQDWGWPPLEVLDRKPYAAELDRDSQTLKLTSSRFELAGSELTVSKCFALNRPLQAVDIEYTIQNHGAALKLAGWEISRVAAEGVTYFAGQGSEPLGGLPMPSVTCDDDGIVWMRHSGQRVEAKLGADATHGFVAYAAPTLLFLKTFPDAPAGSSCPNEAEIELYVLPERYVEIEQQSAAQHISTGQSLVYRLTWFLRELPEALRAKPTNQSLLEFAREVGKLSR